VKAAWANPAARTPIPQLPLEADQKFMVQLRDMKLGLLAGGLLILDSPPLIAPHKPEVHLGLARWADVGGQARGAIFDIQMRRTEASAVYSTTIFVSGTRP
jgi:hypothetical protein